MISADVYSTGEIKGFFQSIQFCAIGCINYQWNYEDWAIGTSIGPKAGFSFNSGVRGSGRDVLRMLE